MVRHRQKLRRWHNGLESPHRKDCSFSLERHLRKKETESAMNVMQELRKLRWRLGRRTLAPAKAVTDDLLRKMQALHGSGRYEDALQLLSTSSSRETDPRQIRLAGLCRLGLREIDSSIVLFLRARD